jgi:hypothetical protein
MPNPAGVRERTEWKRGSSHEFGGEEHKEYTEYKEYNVIVGVTRYEQVLSGQMTVIEQQTGKRSQRMRACGQWWDKRAHKLNINKTALKFIY